MSQTSNYEEYNRAQRWRDDLSRRLAHKAVDIPLGDDMIVQQRYGIGWKELTVITILVIATFLFLRFKNQPTPVNQPTDQTSYDIDFFDLTDKS